MGLDAEGEEVELGAGEHGEVLDDREDVEVAEVVEAERVADGVTLRPIAPV